MNKQKDKPNKKTLLNVARSSMDEEFGPIESSEFNSNTSENNEISSKDKNYKPEGPRYNKLREKGDWESDISEITPPKKVERISIFKRLANGLTPHEMMYGKRENDSDYLNKELE